MDILKNKNLLLGIVAIIIILIGFLYFGYASGFLSKIFPSNKPQVDTTGIILFYGDGCPHCKNVDDFISTNKIEEKVKFIKLEVFNNKDNANILIEKAGICKMQTESVGVPFLWDGKGCVVGDQEIVKFFQNKINDK